MGDVCSCSPLISPSPQAVDMLGPEPTCRTSSSGRGCDWGTVGEGQRDHAHCPWAPTSRFPMIEWHRSGRGGCPGPQLFVAFLSVVPCPCCGTCMPSVLAGQLQGPRSTPVGSLAPRKHCQHIHGVRLGIEVHFLTRVVTCESGGATVGSAADTGAAFGASHGRLCMVRAVHREPRLLLGQY